MRTSDRKNSVRPGEAPVPGAHADYRNPVVLSLGIGGWGDRLLSLPALCALEALFPNRLVLVTESCTRLIYTGLKLRAFCGVETSSRGISFDPQIIASAIPRCDVLLSLNPGCHPEPNTPVYSLIDFLRPLRSIGFSPAYDVVVPPSPFNHRVDVLFEIARCLEPALEPENFARPMLPSADTEHACKIREAYLPWFKVLAVHADTKAEKMWPSAHFASVIDMFLEAHRDFVVFAVGRGDIGLDGCRHEDRVISCYGLGLATSMALVGEADLFLGVDSCMLHIADLLRVPGVGLFGPTDWRQWGFRFSTHRHVCGNGSMDAIQVRDVFEALETLAFQVKPRRNSLVHGRC